MEKYSSTCSSSNDNRSTPAATTTTARKNNKSWSSLKRSGRGGNKIALKRSGTLVRESADESRSSVLSYEHMAYCNFSLYSQGSLVKELASEADVSF